MLGRDYFIDAIDDPDIHWRIYQAKAETLDGTFCTAVELEAYNPAEKERITGKQYVRDVNIQSGNSEKQNVNSAESVLKKCKDKWKNWKN